MKIELVEKNVNLSEDLKEKIEKKIKKLETFLDNETVRLTFRKVKEQYVVEGVVNLPKNKTFRSEKRGYHIIDAVVDVEESLSRQLRKNKEKKFQAKRAPGELPMAHDAVNEIIEIEEVVREKIVPVSHESDSMAIDSMEDLGHDFHLYLDKDGIPSVVYRRNDGGYGIIRMKD